MFKDVQKPKNDEAFKFAITTTIIFFMIITLAASYGISDLI
jgi:hypothetical protein